MIFFVYIIFFIYFIIFVISQILSACYQDVGAEAGVKIKGGKSPFYFSLVVNGV